MALNYGGDADRVAHATTFLSAPFDGALVGRLIAPGLSARTSAVGMSRAPGPECACAARFVDDEAVSERNDGSKRNEEVKSEDVTQRHAHA